MKKIFLSLILLLTFWGIKGIKADNYHLTKDDYQDIYFVQNGGAEHYMSDIQFHFTLNGKTAYCLDPTAPIKTFNYSDLPFESSNYDVETIDYFNKVIYYGYDYPNHQTARYYMATQALIWEKVSPYLIEFYTKQYGYGDYINVDYEKKQILNLVNQEDKLPYFANKHYSYVHSQSLTFEDEALENYEIVNSTWKNVQISENKLMINDLDEFKGQIIINLRRKSYRNDEAKYYVAASSQSLMTGGRIDDDISLTININWGNIQIQKTDIVSKLPIKSNGFVFNIKNKEIGEYIYVNGSKEIETDNDGIISLEHLPYGIYEITEIKTLDGYKLNTEVKEVILNEENKQINFENEREKGQIEIIKYGEIFKNGTYDFTPLKDIQFELYALDDIITLDGIKHFNKDELILTQKTNEEGIVIFENLEIGSYYIKEKVGDNYIDNNEKHIFDLTNGMVQSKKVYNYLKKTNLKIQKIDATSKLPIKASGFIFNIKNKEKGEYIYVNGSKEIETNSDGIIFLEHLPYGTYEIEEIKTLDGYKLNTEVKEVILDEENKQINFENERDKGQIEIIKYGEIFKNNNYNFEVLKDIQFELYALDDIITLDGVKHFNKDELILIKKSNEEGIVTFENIEIGSYYIKEKVGDNYIDNNEKYIFDLTKGKAQSQKVYNYLKKTNLKIKKVDSITKEPLSNTIFEIFYNDESLGQYETDVNGLIEIENIPISVYKIVEVKAHDGYSLLDDENFINLNKENEIIIENEKQITIPNAMKNDNQKLILLSIILIGSGLLATIKNN